MLLKFVHSPQDPSVVLRDHTRFQNMPTYFNAMGGMGWWCAAFCRRLGSKCLGIILAWSVFGFARGWRQQIIWSQRQTRGPWRLHNDLHCGTRFSDDFSDFKCEMVCVSSCYAFRALAFYKFHMFMHTCCWHIGRFEEHRKQGYNYIYIYMSYIYILYIYMYTFSYVDLVPVCYVERTRSGTHGWAAHNLHKRYTQGSHK